VKGQICCILAGATLVLAGCASPAAPPARPAGCESFRLPTAPAGGPPVAILKDAAGGPAEYLVGSPGGRLAVMPGSDYSGIPRFRGGHVVYTALNGSNPEIRQSGAGECPRRLAAGVLDQLSPDGTAMTIFSGNQRQLVGIDGKLRAKLNNGTYAWTRDGHLVQSDGREMVVTDAFGKGRRSLLTGYNAVMSSLGRSSVIVSTDQVTNALDTGTGQSSPIDSRRLIVAAGSPDGRYVAALDQNGDGTLRRADGTGAAAALPRPGPAVNLVWSPDSAWVAVQSQYGGAVLHVADGRVIELGSVNVVAW
jgi:hypothetical protein